MGQVFTPPTEVTIPTLSFRDIEGYKQACKKFTEDLKDWCIKRAERANADTTYIGEVIRFPVADSYAEYMVACLKPVQLIHIPLWDAWDFQYANRLTKKDIIEQIDRNNRLNNLLTKK